MASFTFYCYGPGSTTANDSWSGSWADSTTAADSTWSCYIYPNSYSYLEPEAETEDQRQARLQREEQQAAATKRAEELLKEYIGVEAFGQLHEVGYIELDSQHYKGRKYRVPANHMAYIEVLDEQGKVIDTLCVHPAIECPPPDHILTRVIMLQNDEESLLTAANHWGPRERSYYEE